MISTFLEKVPHLHKLPARATLTHLNRAPSTHSHGNNFIGTMLTFKPSRVSRQIRQFNSTIAIHRLTTEL